MPQSRLHPTLLFLLMLGLSSAQAQSSFFSKDLAPVTDLWLDLCYGPHKPGNLEDKMAVFAALGFSRYYFVALAPGAPAFASRFLDLPGEPERYGHYGATSLDALGDPNAAVLAAARAAGLEPFAVFKPYESGSGRTLPIGQSHPTRSAGLPDVGGTAFGFDSFTLENPHMRLQRHPDEIAQLTSREPITRITIQLRAPNLTKPPPSLADSIRLYTSRNNGTYSLHPSNHYEVSTFTTRETLRDAEGRPLVETSNSPVTVLEITGLALPSDLRFIAVEWEGAAELIPASMVQVSGPDAPITVTATTRVRQSLIPLNGERDPVDFRSDGFEFNEYGWGRNYPGWEKAQRVGIARGKNTHLKGTLCEAYPEVRAHWLQRIEELLEQGVSGIDIRLVGHSAMDPDFASYGYNAPVLEAFRKKFGREPDRGIEDFQRLMRVRGEIFEGFLREARDLIHRYDAKLQVHLHSAYLVPETEGAFRSMVQWGMPKLQLDWRELLEIADEITLKDHFHGEYDATRAVALKREASAQQKPVWIHAYLTQGNDLQPGFFEAAAQDDLITGVLLYETVKRNNPNHGGPARPGIVGIAPQGGLYLDGQSIQLIRKLQGDKVDAEALDRIQAAHEDLRPPEESR